MIVARILVDNVRMADGQFEKSIALCAADALPLFGDGWRNDHHVSMADVLPVSGDGWHNRLDACVVEEIGVITPDQWNALTHLVAEDEVELENKLAGRQQTTWLK